MARKTTPTFIHTMPLKVSLKDRHALEKRFGVLHFAYNAVLQEMLKRLDKMRADSRYQALVKVESKKATTEEKKTRSEKFKELRVEFGFTEFDAHAVSLKHINASGFLKEHIDAHTTQTLASRAFKACERYAFAKGGRPRFKRHNQINSVEGKAKSSPLQFNDGKLWWGGKRRDRRLCLRPIFDKVDAKGVETHALSGAIKFARLLRKIIKGEARYFVQLACEGTPIKRYEAKEGVVGIDLGPSTVAIVGDDYADLHSLLPEIKDNLKRRLRLQRKMARSLRMNNPQCFDEKGAWRKGVRPTNFSKTYRKSKAALAEHERKFADTRKRAHNHAANVIISNAGTRIKTEKLNMVAWQKMWGRRMRITAPSMFMEILCRKAENAGGRVYEFNPAEYKLSQFDHTDGSCVKKPLSLRWHTMRDNSGIIVQRDIYSAWLARYIENGTGFDTQEARADWGRMHFALVACQKPVLRKTAGIFPEKLMDSHQENPLMGGFASASNQLELSPRLAA